MSYFIFSVLQESSASLGDVLQLKKPCSLDLLGMCMFSDVLKCIDAMNSFLDSTLH